MELNEGETRELDAIRSEKEEEARAPTAIRHKSHLKILLLSQGGQKKKKDNIKLQPALVTNYKYNQRTSTKISPLCY